MKTWFNKWFSKCTPTDEDVEEVQTAMGGPYFNTVSHVYTAALG